ncbi:MAG: Do family serine endopeptidase [Candidatus Rokubacteria bacterium]|nr:Do family serine endopeptidase [Candidatus Rokubacteria bacterium]
MMLSEFEAHQIMTPRTLRALLVVLLVLAAGAGGFALRATLSAPRISPPPLARPEAAPVAEALQSAFIRVAEQVRPAVVNIGTVHLAKARRPFVAPGPHSEDPVFRDFFEQFFGPRQGPRGEFRQPSLGSGVIIDKRGFILTNFHVVKGADEVIVKLASNKEYRGRTAGTDPKTDLAVVKIQPEAELTVARLGDSERLRVGEWAIAIGNPFGLDQTVTVGVISATGRSEVGIATYENFIQTDASINPGNSGGPLLNLKGEVIGINTAIVATGQGIGFAIPINMVRRVAGQLVEKGKVIRGWLGIAVQPVSPELSQSLGASGTRGAIVASVYPGSPAADAGLQQGDLILAFDGTQLEDYHHLQRLVAETEVGKTVTLRLLRKKKALEVQVKVGETPAEGTAKARP